MFTLTEAPGTDWIPLAIFALIVSGLMILIGKPIFKNKPPLVFVVPAILLASGAVMIILGQNTDDFGQAFALIFYGFLILIGGAGALVGALVLFFIIYKAVPKKRHPDDVF